MIKGKVLIIRDELEIKQAIKVQDILFALWDFDNWLRSEHKYKDNEPAYDIRQKFHEFLSDHDVNLDNLIE